LKTSHSGRAGGGSVCRGMVGQFPVERWFSFAWNGGSICVEYAGRHGPRRLPPNFLPEAGPTSAPQLPTGRIEQVRPRYRQKIRLITPSWGGRTNPKQPKIPMENPEAPEKEPTENSKPCKSVGRANGFTRLLIGARFGEWLPLVQGTTPRPRPPAGGRSSPRSGCPWGRSIGSRRPRD